MEGEARVRRIAKKRAVAEKRKAAARARQAARKAERVQAMQEEAQRQREEAAAISLGRAAEAAARIRVQKEQQREEVLARNREKREALRKLEYTEANLTDLIIMGSVELTDPKNSLYLGSVSAAVSKRTLAHVLVAKNFA